MHQQGHSPPSAQATGASRFVPPENEARPSGHSPNPGTAHQDLTPFFADRPCAQALERLETLAAWMAGINTQNHDGVTLTPALVSHLSSGDIQARIADLDQRAPGD